MSSPGDRYCDWCRRRLDGTWHSDGGYYCDETCKRFHHAAQCARRAVLCPVCMGAGTRRDEYLPPGSHCTCHGCDGKGWVVV